MVNGPTYEYIMLGNVCCVYLNCGSECSLGFYILEIFCVKKLSYDKFS